MASEMTIHHTVNGIPFNASLDSSDFRAAKEQEATESARLWAQMSEETRDVYRRVAKVSLELLHSSVEYWLPHALIENAPGDKIQIINEILFTDVHAQVSQMDEATAFEEARMMERIKAKVSRVEEARTDQEFMDHVDDCLSHGTRLSVDEAKRLRLMVG
jgi:hypothetical protein